MSGAAAVELRRSRRGIGGRGRVSARDAAGGPRAYATPRGACMRWLTRAPLFRMHACALAPSQRRGRDTRGSQWRSEGEREATRGAASSLVRGGGGGSNRPVTWARRWAAGAVCMRPTVRRRGRASAEYLEQAARRKGAVSRASTEPGTDTRMQTRAGRPHSAPPRGRGPVRHTRDGSRPAPPRRRRVQHGSQAE